MSSKPQPSPEPKRVEKPWGYELWWLTRGPSAEELTTEEIGPGFTWRVEPGTVHSIEALEDSDVIEVSTPHLDDVVRLRDHYGREG